MKNTMINIFKKLGFEEIKCEPIIHKAKDFILHQCDFETGGKMEKFAHYTKQRFEEEFDVIVWCA